MRKYKVEELDTLHELAKFYGLPLLYDLMEDVVDDIQKESLTIGLDSDPQKASLQLYAARMRAEGAKKLQVIIKNRLDGFKQGGNR